VVVVVMMLNGGEKGDSTSLQLHFSFISASFTHIKLLIEAPVPFASYPDSDSDSHYSTYAHASLRYLPTGQSPNNIHFLSFSFISIIHLFFISGRDGRREAGVNGMT
jgi:hypothetical protein